ncbi:type II toxin-antitoxin system VapC family toxin [Amycolatopsis sp. FBCC-B4732]|uniref:type II toxin-antitoxin system VapC family toxin n=1 Tax=Amycolatopsis sp. FBCC-B4732 TaxID=3079339 RepID=UPI001FF58E1E|nr:type II toxin-antitoxin system VapC family toxin [Amycolatopsis sp. FBCC-B4732]UOX87471.1 type II toxin-antitoxin system VapC family toxin [Amycolatopsis sp. FBCC-B4732]
MAERHELGVLDTCVYLDLVDLDPEKLPVVHQITTVTMAELHQGVVLAKNPATKAARTEDLAAALVDYVPLPFDADASTRFGSLAALTVAAKRDPRPRKMDLMIAAIASVHGLPLYTRNAKDFRGLENLLEVVEV